MKSANYAPVYAAALYPEFAEIARLHGYALAAHGSLARDFDLICVPWAEAPSDPQTVVDAIEEKFAVRHHGAFVARAHGRLVMTLTVGFGECFVDLSFMPRLWEPVE
jgi:hypothetical protein